MLAAVCRLSPFQYCWFLRIAKRWAACGVEWVRLICWLLHGRWAVSLRIGLSCMCSTYLWLHLLPKCIFMGWKMTFSSERLYDLNVFRVGFRYFKTWFYYCFSFASKIVIDIRELFFLQIYLSSKSLHFSVWSIRSCYIWRSSKTASIQKENASLIRWVWLGKHVVFLFSSSKHREYY